MSSLSTDLFDYDLPDHLIAQSPAARRDASRLLVVRRDQQSIEHRQFRELPELLDGNDLLIRNNAAVLPARLRAVRPTGGAVECFLLRTESTDGAGLELWWCLLRPGKRLPVGATFARAGAFTAEVREKHEDGVALVAFTVEATGQTLKDVANQHGEMPLPPYIARPSDDERRSSDLERYQTVYADRSRQVAVAAPTAGLHFTPEILTQLDAKGLSAHEVTLHVGLGTFRPVTAENITDHDIHRELYELPVATQRAVLQTARRRVAVGTTSVRAIEDFCAKHDHALDHPCVDEAGIFIYPPRTFRGVDALITNFHQPRSTLLCLVSAFLTPGHSDGIAWIKEIYAEAIAQEYRFFSYGDAMLIL